MALFYSWWRGAVDAESFHKRCSWPPGSPLPLPVARSRTPSHRLSLPLAPLLSVTQRGVLATCSRQRLINGLQAQARVPGSIFPDGQRQQHQQQRPGCRSPRVRRGQMNALKEGRGRSPGRGCTGRKRETDRVGRGRGGGGTESRGHVKLANNLNSPFKS